MANTPLPSEKALDELFSQVVERLNIMKSMGMLDCELAELGETFPLWILSEVDISQRHNDYRAHKSSSVPQKAHPIAEGILQWAKPTGLWHHQVFCDNKFLFARSKASPKNKEQLVLDDLFVSKLAEDIDEAIELVDKISDVNDERETDIRILMVPECYICAFWLNRQNPRAHRNGEHDSVLIVSAPNKDQIPAASSFLSPEAFLSVLSSDVIRSEFFPTINFSSEKEFIKPSQTKHVKETKATRIEASKAKNGKRPVASQPKRAKEAEASQENRAEAV